jgi:Zn-dependent alcohol dehydrogenase
VCAVDILDGKLDMAKRFGATHVLRGDDPELERRLFELCPAGFDACVDATGKRSVKELSYNVCAPTGKTVWAGVSHVDDKIGIDSSPLHFGRKLVGSHGGDSNPDKDIIRYLGLYDRGDLDLSSLITHRMPLERINDGIECLRSGVAGRVIIGMHDQK